MKKYTKVLLFIFFMMIQAEEQKPLYQVIAKLRSLQASAGVPRFLHIDKLVAEKKPAGMSVERHYSFFYILIHYLPFIIWQIVCLSALWGLLLLIILKKNKYRKICIIIICISGLSCIIHYYYNRQRWAVIKESSVLLGSPDNNSFIRRSLEQLQEVRVIKEENNWSQIKVNDMIGWIKNEKLYEIRK